MKIEKIKILNYKIFEEFSLSFNDDLNIIVGNNETGKSTLLEAINLGLTSQISGKSIQYELSPYLFNINSIKNYIENLQKDIFTPLPRIMIEIYLKEENNNELTKYQGINNSENSDCPGVALTISFNDDYLEEYKEYVKNPQEVKTIPIEYYSWNWFSFANNTFKFSQLPSKVMLIDRSENKSPYDSDRFLSKIIEDSLDHSENASLSLLYRKQKELFANETSMQKINEKLSTYKEKITDRDFQVSIDVSSRNNWEKNLTLYIDNVPLRYIGKGEQGAIKTKLALQTKMEKSHIVMVEEPETNLSYTNLNKLTHNLIDACTSKQLIITTHSTFLMNKIGIDKVIFLSNNKVATMTMINKKTKEYFQKLPGYDTLRMIIADKSILVEGRSDELIVQKAYLNIYNCLPLDHGIDVLTVGGLVFKRFMEIAKLINKEIIVVTDNDGDSKAVRERYKEFCASNIKLIVDNDDLYPTLEPQIVKVNELSKLNDLFKTQFKTKEEIIEYMKKNKSDCALKIFETEEEVFLPDYVYNAFK